jgi:hypothetical protein
MARVADLTVKLEADTVPAQAASIRVDAKLRPLASYLDGFEYQFALETARWHALRAFDESLAIAGEDPVRFGWPIDVDPPTPTLVSLKIAGKAITDFSRGDQAWTGSVLESFRGLGSAIGQAFGAAFGGMVGSVQAERERIEALVPADYLPDLEALERYELYVAGVPAEFVRDRFGWMGWDVAAVIKIWQKWFSKKGLEARLQPAGTVTDRPVFSWPAMPARWRSMQAAAPDRLVDFTLGEDGLAHRYPPADMPAWSPAHDEGGAAARIAAEIDRLRRAGITARDLEQNWNVDQTPDDVYPDLPAGETPARRVVATFPVRCPECGSEDLRWGSSSMVYRELRGVAICNGCGLAFTPKAP